MFKMISNTRHCVVKALLVIFFVSVGGACKNKHDSPQQTLLVFAAASLNDVFSSIAKDFEKQNPSIDVEISFAGSQSLRTQIENGAKPDVFASANEKHIERLVSQKLAKSSRVFALNQMVVALSKKQKIEIENFKALPSIDKLVLAGTSVPAGTYAEKVLANAEKEYGPSWRQQVNEKIVSRETHVRQTLQKVILGEADAALVYATDVASSMENIKVVSIPSRFNVEAKYPVAQIGIKNEKLSMLFIDFLGSPMGREKLQIHGFVLPE